MVSEHNPTDALNQALSEQRVDGAEKSTLEIIARALDVPLGVVHRVIYAYEELTKHNLDHLPDTTEEWKDLIEDYDVRQAINKHMEAGARRYMVRRAIENNQRLSVLPQALLPASDMNSICNGCPIRMECVLESLHTPEQCYGVDGRNGRIQWVLVTPLRIHKGKVDVEATQPMGKYRVPIGAFLLHRY